MKHLDEDELIELYYEESASASNAHLRACRECSAQYAELKQSLDAIRPPSVPQRSPDYGERVWQALRPQLTPHQKKMAGWRSGTAWRPAALVFGCVVLLAAAFLIGRYWERNVTKTPTVASNPQAAQRVVLVVLTDHLDRTERLLVQLEHADLKDSTDQMQMQSEARELLASNRLYRATASSASNPELTGTLDRLEGVLAEIANDPNLTAADLERVRKDMNTQGILFEIRVLRARGSDQQGEHESAKGASI